MCQPPLDQSVMAIFTAAELHTTTDKLRPIPSPRHQRRYEVRVSDGRTLELVLAPSTMARLLRSERSMINSEATVVRWIHEAVSHEESRGQAPSVVGNVTSPSSTSCDDPPDGDPDLSDFLPKLIYHCPASKESGTPSSIFQRSHGATIASLSRGLTVNERRHVDFQRGRLARQLSKMKSPSGMFGLAVAVLTPSHSSRHYGETHAMPRSGGSRTWSAAFHSMLEGILRDGEDMAVTIAYSTIRQHFRRLSHLLDSVMIPRLVIIDGAEHSNLLVTRTLETSDDFLREKQRQTTKSTISEQNLPPTLGSSGVSVLSEEDTEEDEEHDDDDSGSDNGDGLKGSEEKDTDDDERKATCRCREGSGTKLGTNKHNIRVTGLRDWSNCIFGDPLFARAFSDDPSDAFLRGFYGSEPTPSTPGTPHEDDGPIEDERNSRARLLLYQAYHATVSIVKEYYGQRTEKSRMELAGRKRLGEILVQLEDIDVEPKRRHRRPSGEMSPAKKLRKSPDGDR